MLFLITFGTVISDKVYIITRKVVFMLINGMIYKDKYEVALDKAKLRVSGFVRRCGVLPSDLKAAFLDNTLDFHHQCITLAKTISTGRVFCTTYAGCVAAFAEYFGIPYEAYVGCCLPRDAKGYDKNKAAIEKGNSPTIANHVYIKIGNNIYQLFTDYISNIEIFESERI